jgi:hypothetical protein
VLTYDPALQVVHALHDGTLIPAVKVPAVHTPQERSAVGKPSVTMC